jgi:hypothetical protein
LSLQDRDVVQLKSILRTRVDEAFPEWMDLRTAEKYVSISERKLRDWINRPHDGLPATQVDHGKLLINRHEMDRWLRAHPHRPHAVDLGRIVDDVVSEFRKAS